MATTSFVVNGVRYTREVFTSAPDQVIVVHLRVSRSHSLSLRVRLGRVERFQTKTDGKDGLVMTGALDSGAHDVAGLRYATRVRAFAHGGTIKPVDGDSLLISRADEVTLLVALPQTIAEMLLDSRPNEVRVLPALPSALPDGRVDGLKAMGGVTVGVTWRAGRMTELRVQSERGGLSEFAMDRLFGSCR